MREKNIILSPSLLACDFARAGEQLAALERAGIRQIHLDVMDGIFVPNISFGQVVIRSLRKSTSLFFDTHLMITEPERYIEDFAAAGSDRITVHLESCADVGPALDRIAAAGVRPALSVKPGTPAEAAFPYLDRCAALLVMTVEPGFGGQKFMADMMPKVQTVRGYIDALNPACELEVDGGVDAQTCKLCIAAGANVLVAGSSVYKSADIPATIAALRG